jgi:hypothetical protein
MQKNHTKTDAACMDTISLDEMVPCAFPHGTTTLACMWLLIKIISPGKSLFLANQKLLSWHICFNKRQTLYCICKQYASWHLTLANLSQIKNSL